MSATAVARVQRVESSTGERTWTVLGDHHLPVGPIEQFLEYARTSRQSPNTVKAYARGLQLWWEYLGLHAVEWDRVGVDDLGQFLNWLRTGNPPGVASIGEVSPRFSESTVALRLSAVLSFYRYHHLNGVEAIDGFYERFQGSGRAYRPMLEHVARRKGHVRRTVTVRRPEGGPVPVLSPTAVAAIKDACARWDDDEREWLGSLRDRLLWTLLEETGMRLGEALGMRHRDWTTGTGDTPYVEVVPREHPHGVRVKGGAYRKLYVSDELDRLYGDYLWLLCELGADLAVDDLDEAYLFCSLQGNTRFRPLRPESVYKLVARLRRALDGIVPVGFTPHWFRHTHATALLLSDIPLHVVSRRLGHRDVQTTLRTYAWVTEDAELRAAADWQAVTAKWRAA